MQYLSLLAEECVDVDREVAWDALQAALKEARLLFAEEERKPAGSLKNKSRSSESALTTAMLVNAWSRVDPETGVPALKLAVSMVEKLDQSREKDHILDPLAGSGALIDRKLSDSLAESIISPGIRSNAYRGMAESWAKADVTVKDAYWSRAFHAATEIKDPYERALIQLECVREAVTASPGWVPRFLREALQAAARIDGDRNQASILGDLGLAWSRLDRNKALEIASMIPAKHKAIRCRIFLGAAEWEADAAEKSALLDMAEKEARQANVFIKDRLWVQVAVGMAGIDPNRAAAWISSMPDIGRVYRNKALSHAAVIAGKNSFRQALEWAESVTEPWLRIHTLAKMARNGQKHFEAFEAALLAAEEEIGDDPDDTVKANLAKGWSYLSEERALEWAGLIEDAGERAKTHARIGKNLAERGRDAAADTAWLRALTAIESLDDEDILVKVRLLLEIAAIQATVSPGQAKLIFETARRMLAG